MTALDTLPDVDLDALLAAELPPCAMRWVEADTGLVVRTCGEPAAVIAHVYAVHGCDMHMRRAPICAPHVETIRAGLVWCCARHQAPVRIEVTS